MRHIALVCLIVLGSLAPAPSAPLAAEVKFPRLTGAVVDQANILPWHLESRISRIIEQHEQSSGNRIVVVTVDKLQRLSVEQYARRLRARIGLEQSEKDNSVLLLVAKKARKVRIDVGPGANRSLTDSKAKNIITAHILPKMREGNLAEGIRVGTEGIVAALEGHYASTDFLPFDFQWRELLPWLILPLAVVFSLLGFGRRRRYYGGYRTGGFVGGFSGGGGGGGGGGASGGW